MNMMMKNAFTAFFLGLILVANVAESASSHAAPAPAVDCSSLVLNMADCLSFVTSGSTARKPEGTCCSGLKTVLKADADCLCEAFKNSAQLGVTLNVTKALTLPAACRISAPSVNNCALTVAGGAPAQSPMAMSPSSNAAAPASVSGSTEVAPAPAPGSSGACAVTTFALGPFVLAAVVASLF